MKYGGYSKNSGNSKLLDMVVLHTRGRNASRGPRRASSYDGWAKNYSEKLRCLHLVPSYFLPRRAAMSWRDTFVRMARPVFASHRATGKQQK